MNIFKRIFNKKKEISQEKSLKNVQPIKEKTINELKQFDDVWIKIGDKTFEGWIVERIKDTVSVVYTNSTNNLCDINFKLERPYNKTIIETEEATLILNKYE